MTDKYFELKVWLLNVEAFMHANRLDTRIEIRDILNAMKTMEEEDMIVVEGEEEEMK